MAAPRTLWLYILRDVSLQATIGLAALTLLLLAQAAIRFIDRFATAGVPFEAFPALAWILLTRYSVYALPSALVFGVLLSFGRMSADGEIIAMRSSGMSVRRMLPPVLAIGLTATCATAWVLFEIEPRGNARLRELERVLLQSVRLVKAGEFRTVGDRTIYVHEVGDESCPMRGVLVSDSSEADQTLYIAARCGTLRSGASGDPSPPEGRDDGVGDGHNDGVDNRNTTATTTAKEVDPNSTLVLALVDGSVHFSDLAAERYRHIRFQSLETSLDLDAYLHPNLRPRDLSLMELVTTRRKIARGEPVELFRGELLTTQIDIQIHRRLAFPIASLALALLAVPLGVRPMRSGRSWGALTAIGVMLGYWSMFSVAEIAAGSELVPVAIAMWAPDVLVVAFALWLIRRSMRSDS